MCKSTVRVQAHTSDTGPHRVVVVVVVVEEVDENWKRERETGCSCRYEQGSLKL